jgi:hypothetical protein
MKYPVFSPPISLAAKAPKEWSSAEAKEYFRWFEEVASERREGLLTYLGLERDLSPEALLSKAQAKFEALLRQGQFRSHDLAQGALTNEGYAIAADLGLLVAQLLIENSQGKISWEILKKPRGEQSFNLPVLRGFGLLHLDPVGGSIGDAAWIASGNSKPDAWVKTYKYWLDKAATSLTH